MIVSLAAGILLGLLFYGGLWVTIRRLVKSRHPAAVMLSSYLFRMAVVMSVFVFIARGGWQNVVACLAGFIAGRVVVSRMLPLCT